MKQMTITAAPDNLDTVLAFVREEMQAVACPARAVGQVELAVEEIFVNIARYAYAPRQGQVSIRCETQCDPWGITITFADQGRPYNPLERPEPDLTLGAEDREIGGLGIVMVKKLMDRVHYEFRDGTNRLTIQKRG